MSWTNITHDPSTWPHGYSDILIKKTANRNEILLGKCTGIKPNVVWEYSGKSWSFVRPNLRFMTPDGEENIIDAIAWHPIPTI